MGDQMKRVFTALAAMAVLVAGAANAGRAVAAEPDQARALMGEVMQHPARATPRCWVSSAPRITGSPWSRRGRWRPRCASCTKT